MFLQVSLILNLSIWLSTVVADAAIQTDDVTSIQDLVDANNYDKTRRPLSGVKPMNVSSQLIITSLGPISEQDMTFELSFIHRQLWHDPRLAHNGTVEEITSSGHPGEKIWMPDIYIRNVRAVTYYKDFTRTVIQRNGSVFFSQKVSAKCICNMDLTRYPLDKQICHVQMESYAYSKQDVILNWASRDVSAPDQHKLSLTGYELLHVWKNEKDFEYGEGEFNKFSNLFLKFQVKRTSVYYAYKAFIPTIFLSLFNIGSYFIPDDAMPARVTLIITTFLANMLILQSISDQTVKVSYTTAMQLFLLINVLFLMTSIVQYLVLLHLRKAAAIKKKSHAKSIILGNHLPRDEKKSVNKIQENGGVIHFNGSFEAAEDERYMNDKLKPQEEDGSSINSKSHFEVLEKALTLTNTKKDTVHVLDRVFRVIMPFLYLVFCTVYFSYYLI